MSVDAVTRARLQQFQGHVLALGSKSAPYILPYVQSRLPHLPVLSLLLFELLYHPSSSVTSLQIRQQIPQPSKRLNPTRQDLVRRQHEPIVARIPELGRKGILRLRDIGQIVHAAARNLVDGRTDGAGLEDGAIDGFDSSYDTSGKGLILGVVGGNNGTRVAVR